MPDSATDNTHGKGTTEIVQDNNGAGISTMIRSHFVYILDAGKCRREMRKETNNRDQSVEGYKKAGCQLDGDG